MLKYGFHTMVKCKPCLNLNLSTVRYLYTYLLFYRRRKYKSGQNGDKTCQNLR